MAKRKISDFFCVGVSGPTIDGRTLDPQWFMDASKHFDPKLYGARVWYEHYRWIDALGDVVAMKTEKQEDGTYKHYNRISPLPRLIEMNQERRKIYSSVEILRNFASRNHAYQIGLGVTDTPASISTDELKFNALKENSDFLCNRLDSYKDRITDFDPDELEIFIGHEWPDLEFTTEKSFFSSLFSASNPLKNKSEDIDMTQEQMKAAMADVMKPFNEKLDALEQKITEKETPADHELTADEKRYAALEKKYNAAVAKSEELQTKIDKGDEPETKGDDDKFKIVEDKLDALIEKNSALEKQLKNTRADDPAGENNGSEKDNYNY